jgi:hypothetical protein
MLEPIDVTLLHSLATFFSEVFTTVELESASFVDAQPLKPRSARGISVTVHFFSIVYIRELIII